MINTIDGIERFNGQKKAEKIDSRINDIKVLMYHRILTEKEAESDKHWTGVSIADFKDHLRMLEVFGYTPITFNDVRLHLNDDLDLPKRPVIITFDDGYEDFYKLAFPALQEYGMHAVVFALGDRTIKENIWEESEEISRAPLMCDDQILELYKNGIEIGAHSCTHPKLTELSKDRLRCEIFTSKKNLEALLGAEVHTFCYPYGLENNEVRSMVKQAGFMFGCSVYTGPLRFGESMFSIRRVAIKNGMGSLSFGLRILTPFEYLEVGGSKVKSTLNKKQRS